MAKKRKKTGGGKSKTNSQVGDPTRWSIKVLLGAYVHELRENGPNVESYANLLRARGQNLPTLQREIKIGARGDKNPRTTYSQLHKAHLVRIMNGVEELGTFPALGLQSDWEELAKQYGVAATPWIEGIKTEVVEVPLAEATLDTVEIGKANGQWQGGWHGGTYSKRPLMCLYDATKNYLESLLGIKLSSEDETFFINHPLVEQDGVPFQHTLRVVQELIDPYGVRITRVQLAPLYNIKGDILQWRSILGCNPLALANRNTTNEEFFAAGGGENKDQFRFEYTTETIRPSISCGIITSAQASSSGGHAMFVPPRRNITGTLLSFELGFNNVWKKDPSFEEVAPKVFTPPKAEIHDVFDLGCWYGKYRKVPPGIVKTIISGIRGQTQAVVKKERESSKWCFDPFSCYMCSRQRDTQKHTFQVPGLCDECWSSVCDTAHCGTDACMKSNIKIIPPFKYVSCDAGRVTIAVKCPRCHEDWELRATHGKGGQIARAVKALNNYALDLEIDLKHGDLLRKDQESSAEPTQEPATSTPLNEDDLPKGWM